MFIVNQVIATKKFEDCPTVTEDVKVFKTLEEAKDFVNDLFAGCLRNNFSLERVNFHHFEGGDDGVYTIIYDYIDSDKNIKCYINCKICIREIDKDGNLLCIC